MVVHVLQQQGRSDHRRDQQRGQDALGYGLRDRERADQRGGVDKAAVGANHRRGLAVVCVERFCVLAFQALGRQ